MSATRPPETTIVIRAFNEERWLSKVFEAIRKQSYKDYEIVVVDSGSVDRTRDIAGAEGALVVRLRADNFTFGHSLNVGISEARGSLVAILSAHAIPADEQWLERLLAPLRHPDTAMVFGGQRGHALSKFSEARDFERMFPPERQNIRPPNYFANNANSAIRRSLWEAHPFDEGLPGLEDIEWAKHWIDLGMEVIYESAACIFHVHEESWQQVRNRYHREGIAARWVGTKYLRQIPREVFREAWWFLLDLRSAARGNRLVSLAGEIGRFRYNKLVGTVRGIVSSRGFTNPARRAQLYFQKSFPSVVIRAPHEAAIEHRAVPSLRPGEVLIRVAYEGICATDLEIFEGRLGYYKSGMGKYPIVPGHESSGTIAALGAKVIGFAEGDPVVVECIQGCGECAECRRDNPINCRERREVGVIGHDGGYSEYLVTRARFVHKVPNGVSLAQAALAEPLAVVLKALRRLRTAPSPNGSSRCAVIGAGTIGHLTARVLALRGHEVTVFDREQARLSLFDGGVATSMSLTDLNRFDWLIEATGDQSALTSLLEGSATGATLLLMGFPYAQRDFTFESLVAFDKSVLGSVGSSGTDFEEALATVGKLDTRPFLKASYSLEEYERAWEDVRSREHIKVMLKIDPSAN